MSFSDPAVRTSRLPERHPTHVEQIDQADSEAVDAWCAAIDAEAEAENSYLAAFAEAYLHGELEEHVAVTARAKWADQRDEVVERRQAWNLARAAERRCRAKVQELERRSMRAMSHQRFVREATGG